MTLALAVAAVVGPGRRRDRGLVTAAVVVPVVVFATSPVLLPHYRFLWLPGAVVLAALGLAALARRPEPAARVLAVVLAGAMLVTGVRSLAFVTIRDVSGYRAVAELLERQDRDGAAVLVRGFSGQLTHYLDVEVVDRLPAAEVVVLDPVRTDLRPVPGLRDRLEGNPSWRPLEVDRLDVWVRR